MGTRKVRISITIDIELLEKIRKLSYIQDKSVSQYINHAMKRRIEATERKNCHIYDSFSNSFT